MHFTTDGARWLNSGVMSYLSYQNFVWRAFIGMLGNNPDFYNSALAAGVTRYD